MTTLLEAPRPRGAIDGACPNDYPIFLNIPHVDARIPKRWRCPRSCGDNRTIRDVANLPEATDNTLNGRPRKCGSPGAEGG